MVALDPIALLAGAVVSMVVGFVWYSPMLFGGQWMKLVGIKDKDMEAAKKEMPKMMVIAFIATLFTVFVLTHFSVYAATFYGQQGLSVSMTAGFFAWLGFVMPVQLTDWLYQHRAFKLFLINTGYQLASLLAVALVIGLMWSW